MGNLNFEALFLGLRGQGFLDDAKQQVLAVGVDPVCEQGYQGREQQEFADQHKLGATPDAGLLRHRFSG